MVSRPHACTHIQTQSCFSFVDDSAQEEEDEEEDEEEEEEVAEEEGDNSDDWSQAEEVNMVDSDEERELAKLFERYTYSVFSCRVPSPNVCYSTAAG